MSTLDPYAVLGLEPGAPSAEVKAAYRRLARQWHPDKNDAPEAEARFREVATAWEILGDPDRRRRHDLQRGAIGRGELPQEFVMDVADAIERAEHWIRGSVLPAYAQHWRGRGAEMAARLWVDLDELVTPRTLDDPGILARRRANQLAAEVIVTAWMRPSRDATVVVRGQGFWEIGVVPFALWEANLRESAEVDEAVMRLLLARYAQVVSAGRLPPGEPDVAFAREVDDQEIRIQRARWGGWALLGAVLGLLFLAGYNQW